MLTGDVWADSGQSKNPLALKEDRRILSILNEAIDGKILSSSECHALTYYFGNLFGSKMMLFKSVYWEAEFCLTPRGILSTRSGDENLLFLFNLQILDFLKGLTEAIWFARWLPAKHDQLPEEHWRTLYVALVFVFSRTGCLWQESGGNQHLRNTLSYQVYTAKCNSQEPRVSSKEYMVNV